MSKWIKFEKIGETPKTLIYNVVTNDTDFVLGQVKWHSSWRCYAFCPTANTVYEKQCLTDIVLFITNLMNDRKLKKFLENG